MDISCTAVRVPTLRAHAEALTIETLLDISPDEARYVDLGGSRWRAGRLARLVWVRRSHPILSLSHTHTNSNQSLQGDPGEGPRCGAAGRPGEEHVPHAAHRHGQVRRRGALAFLLVGGGGGVVVVGAMGLALRTNQLKPEIATLERPQVGRIRQSLVFGKKGLDLFVCGDQVTITHPGRPSRSCVLAPRISARIPALGHHTVDGRIACVACLLPAPA